jgi:hypothetical protein
VGLFCESVNEYCNAIKTINRGQPNNKIQTYGIPWAGRFWVREQKANEFGSRLFISWQIVHYLFAILRNEFAHSRPQKYFRNSEESSIGGGVSGGVIVFM